MPVLPCCPLSQPAHPAPSGRAAARAASAREPPRIVTLSPAPASAPQATTGHPASWVRPLRPAPCFVGSPWGWPRLPWAALRCFAGSALRPAAQEQLPCPAHRLAVHFLSPCQALVRLFLFVQSAPRAGTGPAVSSRVSARMEPGVSAPRGPATARRATSVPTAASVSAGGNGGPQGLPQQGANGGAVVLLHWPTCRRKALLMQHSQVLAFWPAHVAHGFDEGR